jgi:thymidine kinase
LRFHVFRKNRRVDTSFKTRSDSKAKGRDIPLLVNDCEVVGIDEAQFFDDEIVQVCNDLANQGKRVIVAGLDMDFKGNPFGPMPALMATAEYVTKVHAVCTKTGNLAQYSFRKSPDDSLVVLGEKEAYEPLSRAAFFKLNNQKSAVNNIHPPKKNKK